MEMEVKYKRDANRNYMILEARAPKDYQLRMFCENHIKGLLHAHTSFFDGQEEIYYEISSRQPFNRIYAKKEIGYEDLKRVIYNMENLLQEMKKYLLDSQNLLLAPEFCYCNPETKKTEWVFYPRETEKNDFIELAEFFLEHVDHEDEKAVDLAYKFFKSAREENFVINEMILYVEELDKKEKIGEENYPADIEQKEEWMPIHEVDQNVKENVWDKAKKKIKEKIVGLKVGTMVGKAERKVPMMSVSEWENFSGETYAYTGETMVMGIVGNEREHRMRCLNENEGRNINLSRLPCILGKMPERADVVLPGDGISRMHAKIYEESGVVFLQDLNSTNGTFKNGIRLEANETVQLRVGDEVGFAKLRYIYE